jgi:hypothetical protein
MSFAETPDHGSRPSGPRARRLDALARKLGVELPPLIGPLVAFQLDGHSGDGDPVVLGGDLQAVHPDAVPPSRRSAHDPALDNAIVTLTDHENETLELAAVEGIWCTVISGARLPAAPYFSLTDSTGAIRTWLLLPPPRLMVGIAHLWLPSVPPGSDPRSRGR